jgi:Family of unknown function (DUF6435)
MGLFTKKSPIKKLEAKYDALIAEAFQLSKTNRMASDQKTAEANEVLKKIEDLSKG